MSGVKVSLPRRHLSPWKVFSGPGSDPTDSEAIPEKKEANVGTIGRWHGKMKAWSSPVSVEDGPWWRSQSTCTALWT